MSNAKKESSQQTETPKSSTTTTTTTTTTEFDWTKLNDFSNWDVVEIILPRK